MTTPLPANRSRAWFPGRYVPIRNLYGIEVLPRFPRRRGGVQVARTVIHGTAPELRALAAELVAAADRVDGPRAA